MARKKADRMQVKLQSTESRHFTYTEKNRKNDPQRLELRRYDPELRRYTIYREVR